LKKLIIAVLIVAIALIATHIFGSNDPSTPPTQDNPAESGIPPEILVDTDGDGFNDWFETNIAGYHPNTPNERYFILFLGPPGPRDLDPQRDANDAINLPAQFLIEKGEVPPENIFKLAQEEATASALQDAIEQIGEKSDKNDIVYLDIAAHGPGTIGVTPLDVGFCAADGYIKYVELNEWLNQIEAKVLILSISSCGDELAVPVLEEGPCPRIIYLHAGGGWFLHMLGLNADYSQEITTYYSNDPYISIGEAADCLDDQRVYLSGWNITRERKNAKRIATYKRESGYQVPDESKVKILVTDSSGYVRIEIDSSQYSYTALVDPSNIAYEIYLTDYKIPG
jgi:hypothetical protein